MEVLSQLRDRFCSRGVPDVVVLLDIENNQQCIPELFARDTDALFVISAGRTQTYTIGNLQKLAAALGVTLFIDNFAGGGADKADGRIVSMAKVIRQQSPGCDILSYTRDVAFNTQLRDEVARIKCMPVEPRFDIPDECIEALKRVDNVLVRRYFQRRKKMVGRKKGANGTF